MFSEGLKMKEVYEYPEPFSLRKVEEKQKDKDDPYIFYKEENKRKKRKKQRIYSQLRVIGQVASFAQKLKSTAVLNKPAFRKEELAYIHIDQEEKDGAEVPFKYQNKWVLACQIWSYLIYSIILWKASTEMVLGKISEHKVVEISALLTGSFFGLITINSEVKNEKMAIVKDKQTIRQIYQKNYLAPDILMYIGIIMQLTPLDDQYEEVFYIGRILIFFLVFRIGDIFSMFENKLAISRKSQAFMTILKLFTKMVYALHLASLLLITLSKVQNQVSNETTWVQKGGFVGVPNYQLYIHAWYWSCTIISTVGFGDILPANAFESAVISVLQIFSAIFFGFFLNYIGSALNIFGQQRAQYESQIRRLNNYLNNLHIQDDLKDEARSHLFNKYKTQKIYNEREEDQIYAQLTDNLKQNLKRQNNLTIINDSRLKNVFSDEFLEIIAQKFSKKVYPADSFLFQEKQRNLSLWIIDDGKVSQIPSKNLVSKPLHAFDKNQNTVGWYNFFSGQSFHSNAIANSFVICYRLARSQFLNVLKKFDKEFLKFHEKKQEFLEKNKKYDSNCLGCGKLSHNVLECPRIHYTPKKIRFILECQKSKGEINGENERRKHRRKNRIKKWTVNNLVKEDQKKGNNKKRLSRVQNLLFSSYQHFLDEKSRQEGNTKKDLSEISIDQAMMMTKRKKKSHSLRMVDSNQGQSSVSSIQSYKSKAEVKENKNERLTQIDTAQSKFINEFRSSNYIENVLKKYYKFMQ